MLMPLLAQGQEKAPSYDPGEMRQANDEERAQFTRPGALFGVLPMPDATPAKEADAEARRQITDMPEPTSLLFPHPEFYVKIPEQVLADQKLTISPAATTVRALDEKNTLSADPFAREHQQQWQRTVGVGVETKLMQEAVLTYDSRLGMQGSETSALGADREVESLTPSQRLAARVRVLPRLTINGSVESRTVLDNDLDVPADVERNRRQVEAKVDAWTGATLRGDFREDVDADGETGETVASRNAVGLRLQQTLPTIPVTASLGTRLEQSFDPADTSELTGSSPSVEGSLTWKPKSVLSLKVGMRHRDWDDALGETDRSQNTWFAEHRQELSKRVDWLSRARYENDTRYVGSIEEQSSNASITVGPRFEINDRFNANLEMLQRWEHDTQIETWAPAERRISFSITGEF